MKSADQVELILKCLLPKMLKMRGLKGLFDCLIENMADIVAVFIHLVTRSS